ncbi:cbb3-type cytochrome c oxidase subunit I [Undibacterium jejuense]|uniref:Cbb3-type cytochrome c oxidase subunit I n=1 Tax=Undibacterium jejuense TaxID=1344949 RepID=A0A923KHU0_9BURK|nr:cbb3-type cytochrome c oxidase subunit I [Undibacterium jejuense]MBC3861522.1 cbb3-type cytochrome c oxidase subunit I [Undibacterium jejuense]
MNTMAILLSAFVIAVIGLMFFIWTQRRELISTNREAAESIFGAGEIGAIEDPASTRTSRAAMQEERQSDGIVSKVDPKEIEERIDADRSSASVALLMMSFAAAWLLAGSFFGLISSIKLNAPDWLSGALWLTFGVTRTLHLNIVAYGWAPMACLGCTIWMLPRLLKTTLIGSGYAMLGACVWNLSLLLGLIGIANGYNTGLEWLEIPTPIALGIVVGGALIAMPLVFTLANRKATHLYVSVWYISAALFWFPVLLLAAKLPIHFGIEQATMNWWFGHNVLGLFYTPLSLACIYYLLPKIIGRPVENYNLSLVGFWTLAFFYGQVGGHHLIGSPVPGWLINLSIVQSVMMIVPVAAFTINQHLTMRGHFRLLVHSPTLRFIVFGGMMYTLSSVHGSMEALRSINTITHFTHFTVAHAHLGLYGFVTMVMFGAFYFIMPRIRGYEWPFPKLIALHFWLVVLGFALYFIALSWAGFLQGMMMLDASRPFIDSVVVTQVGLIGRSIGGAVMTLGHIVFVGHFLLMLLHRGPQRDQAALLWRDYMPTHAVVTTSN